ncbi:hypothetical protein COCOBI_01-5010 [Coccomyxa sp. Obi]|nr:hypothetical protein COCOBI_01-5010 [Coccomyxa sp. Obi]
MAHSKTTPLQVLSQVGAGVTVLGIAYYSLFSKKESSNLKPEESERTEGATSVTLAALDREALNTTGKYWQGSGENARSS